MADEKVTFVFRGLTNGQIREGVVRAKDEEDAIQRVLRLGFQQPEILKGKSPSSASPKIPEPLGAQAVPDVPIGLPSPTEAISHREMASALNRQVAGTYADVMDKAMGKKRRQTMVIDTNAQSLARKVDELLEKNGKVVVAQMHPDMHGSMVYLLVVEHDKGE
jgi:hypothetical protein